MTDREREAVERLTVAAANPDSHLDEVLVDAADLRTVLAALETIENAYAVAFDLAAAEQSLRCEAEAKVAAMEPVVRWAAQWRDAHSDEAHPGRELRRRQLCEAVDAYRATQSARHTQEENA